MIKHRSLSKGLGNQKETEQFYDNWSLDYEKTLNNWNYKAPLKSSKILQKYIKKKPRLVLDLACGTGLFAEKIKKNYKNSIIDGSDISKKSLKIANSKNLYRHLYKISFNNIHPLKNKYDLVSLIGAMTYCKNHFDFLNNVLLHLKKNGYFIFTQRTDLWIKYDFDNLLSQYSKNFNLVYKSKSLEYLPRNKDFSKKIKMRIVLLKKN
tara:strand:+ start:89 stop:712 length:624 start_codon:yes stop_codon:yes gene_type:complete